MLQRSANTSSPLRRRKRRRRTAVQPDGSQIIIISSDDEEEVVRRFSKEQERQRRDARASRRAADKAMLEVVVHSRRSSGNNEVLAARRRTRAHFLATELPCAATESLHIPKGAAGGAAFPSPSIIECGAPPNDDDEVRLINPDRELNDTIVNSFLKHVTQRHTCVLEAACETVAAASVASPCGAVVQRHAERRRRAALEDYVVQQEEVSVPSSPSTKTTSPVLGSSVLLTVSSHFLPRWISSWRAAVSGNPSSSVHGEQRGDLDRHADTESPLKAAASGLEYPHVASWPCDDPRRTLMRRMQRWIERESGAAASALGIKREDNIGFTTLKEKKIVEEVQRSPKPLNTLCLRHWVALYDAPMRHAFAAEQHNVNTRELLQKHRADQCPHCRQRGCLLFPIHLERQSHWILVALFVPALPAHDSGRNTSNMPLCKVHVYDSMLWLHHRYSRYTPRDWDIEDSMEACHEGAQLGVSYSDDDDDATSDDDDPALYLDACDGRTYRRHLLRRTLRPLLAAVQLIATEKISSLASSAEVERRDVGRNSSTGTLKIAPSDDGGSIPVRSFALAYPRVFRWRVRWHRFTVTQVNAVDCGVAVCKAADKISSLLAKPLGSLIHHLTSTPSAPLRGLEHPSISPLARSHLLSATALVAHQRYRRKKKPNCNPRGSVQDIADDGDKSAAHNSVVLQRSLELQQRYARLLKDNLSEYRLTMHDVLYPPAQTGMSGKNPFVV